MKESAQIKSIAPSALAACLLLFATHPAAAADFGSARTPAPGPAPRDKPVRIRSGAALKWQEGKVTFLLLDQDCTITHGPLRVNAGSALIRFDPSAARTTGVIRLDLYADRNAAVTGLRRRGLPTDPVYLRLETRSGLILDAPALKTAAAAPKSGVYVRATAWRQGGELPAAGPAPGPQDLRSSLRELDYKFLHWERLPDPRDPKAPPILTLHGNVKIGDGQRRVEADTVRLWLTPPMQPQKSSKPIQRLYAMGAVRYSDRHQSLQADELYLNLLDDRGLAVGGVVARSQDPRSKVRTIVRAPAVWQTGRDRVLARRASVTTCEFAKPHYELAGRNVRVAGSRARKPSPGKKAKEPSDKYEHVVASSTHNVLRIARVPVLYWPYIAHDLKRPGFFISSLEAGSSSDLGRFVLSEWDLYDLGFFGNDWSKLKLEVDYYASRGTAYGLDAEYKLPGAFGLIDTYYICDRKTADAGNRPVKGDDRGRVLWRHRQQLPHGWRGDVEISYLSDANFLETYFEDEFDEGKEQETLVYLRKLSGYRGYTLLVQDRINSFQTVAERRPELAFHSTGAPLAKGKLSWTTDTSLAKLHLNEDERRHTRDPSPVVRFDSDNQFSMPRPVGILKVDPFVGARVSTFSHTVNRGSSTTRQIATYGARATTNFFRTYQPHSDRFAINGLRHVITPRVEYERRFYNSTPPRRLVRHDTTDELDVAHTLLTGLRNRWQTKRRRDGRLRSVDFLTLDVDYVQYPGRRGLNRPLRDHIEADAEWLITDRAKVYSRGNEYNLQEDRMEVVDAGVSFDLSPPVTVGYEHQFVDPAAHDTPNQSVGIFRFGYGPRFTRRRADFETRYDFLAKRVSDETKNPKQLGTKLSFTRDMHCWLLIVSAEFNEGRNDEAVFRVSIQPKRLGRLNL